jgi:hypothetical protein
MASKKRKKKRALKRFSWSQLSDKLPSGKFLVPPRTTSSRWRVMTAAKVRKLREESGRMT